MRLAILRLVGAAPDGLTASDVAAKLDRHPSTVRPHLDVLARTGLLSRARTDARLPGRPAWLYRYADPQPALGMYRSLAAALLQHEEQREEQRDAENDNGPDAERAGQSWGRRLGQDANDATPVDAVLRVLDGLGFAPRVAPTPPVRGGVEVHLLSCPYSDLVARNPMAMCSLHLGLIRGVLAGAGSAAADEAELVPFGASASCVTWLPEPHQRRAP